MDAGCGEHSGCLASVVTIYMRGASTTLEAEKRDLCCHTYSARMTLHGQTNMPSGQGNVILQLPQPGGDFTYMAASTPQKKCGNMGWVY
jgi:hypothetical protein